MRCFKTWTRCLASIATWYCLLTAAQPGLTQEQPNPEDRPTPQELALAKDIEQAHELVRQVRLDPKQPIQFDKLSIEEIQAEMELQQRARRASLVLRIDATQQEYAMGVGGQSLSTVMAAYADLAQFDLERATTATERVRALQPIVNAARQIEIQVRLRAEVGAMGGSFSNQMQSMANRLHWEHQLAKEVLALKQAAGAK